jgi:hypothetical protein
MGLDQYLYKKSYVMSSEWVKPEFRETISMTKGGSEVDTSKIKYIVEEVGYWRKANAIHRWFVENVQNGNDDCREYAVTIKELESLRRDCENVLCDSALREQLLPAQSGFFFGSTDYDEYYEQDLQNTIDIISEILSSEDAKNGEYFYRSSW